MNHPPAAGPRWAFFAGLLFFLWGYGIDASAAADAPEGSPVPVAAARSPGPRPVLGRVPLDPARLAALPAVYLAPVSTVLPPGIPHHAARRVPARSRTPARAVLPRPPPVS